MTTAQHEKSTNLECDEACDHKKANQDEQRLEVHIRLLLLTRLCLPRSSMGVSSMPAMESVSMTMTMAISIGETRRLPISSCIWESMHLEAEQRKEAAKRR